MAIPLITGLLLIMAADATTAAADYTQEVRRDNPIAWWRFQDTAFADGAATKDEMGAHSGTYRGGVTLEAGLSGTGGKAAKFDGRGAYVEIPHHADFTQNTLSVECWFRSTQAWTQANWPASATLLSKGTEGAGSSDWVLLGGAAEDRQGCVIVRPGPKGGPDVVVASPDGLNDDQWHHVVWTRSAAGVNQLYVDGAKVAEIRDSGAAITNDRPIQIGGDPWLGGKSFAGTLAEVAIYGRSLDAARVAAHFAAAPPPARKPRQVLPEARPSLPVTMPARPDGFTPLFDGKSLDGWEGDLKVFRVEDGAIAGGSLRESVRDSVYLATTREFADFELHVKFRAVATKGDEANGGIQFRSRRLPQGTQVSGYQADLGVFKNFPPGIFWGCLFDNARRDRILAGDPRANEPIVRKGDWNQYVIRAEGRHIRLWLNGQQTVDYTEQDEKIPQAGIIALQAHSGPPQELWYKDIVIKDLGRRAEGAATSTPTAAETSAGWVKHDKNPVLGGALGTCFDISVLQVGETYRM